MIRDSRSPMVKSFLFGMDNALTPEAAKLLDDAARVIA